MIDFKSKINAIILVYIVRIKLKICSTIVIAQKINELCSETFEIVIIGFQILDKLVKAFFFQKMFLLANIIMKIVAEMLFLVFNNKNVKFVDKKLI